MAAPISDSIHYAPVSRPYRRHVAWGAALLLHALVVGVAGGWRLAPDTPPSLPVSLDVVLATQPAVEAESAQAIAAANQRGAGAKRIASETIDSARVAAPPAPDAPASPPPAESPASPATPPAPSPPASPPAPEPAPEPPPVPDAEPPPTPEPASPAAEPESPPAPPRAQNAASPSGQALLAQASASVRTRGFEASASEADDDDRPRQAARRAAEARYIDAWTQRVETYGNRFYPAPDALDGQLRIRVVIARDGQLRQAEVVQSSGHPELDRAALETVRGAAPYRPFDSGMGARDSLAITRVWRFGKGNNFGVR